MKHNAARREQVFNVKKHGIGFRKGFCGVAPRHHAAAFVKRLAGTVNGKRTCDGCGKRRSHTEYRRKARHCVGNSSGKEERYHAHKNGAEKNDGCDHSRNALRRIVAVGKLQEP